MQTTRTANYADLRAFMDERMAEDVVAWGHDSVALVEDGRVAAVAGVTSHPECGTVAFAQWHPDRKPGARGIVRLAKALHAPLRRATKPVYATTETQAPGEAALLARLGFTRENEKGVWVCGR